MKGRSLRPRPEQIVRLPAHTLCLTPVARIVKETMDSTRDKFVPLAVAQQMYVEGKLTEIDMGPEFPNSYMEITS